MVRVEKIIKNNKEIIKIDTEGRYAIGFLLNHSKTILIKDRQIDKLWVFQENSFLPKELAVPEVLKVLLAIFLYFYDIIGGKMSLKEFEEKINEIFNNEQMIFEESFPSGVKMKSGFDKYIFFVEYKNLFENTDYEWDKVKIEVNALDKVTRCIITGPSIGKRHIVFDKPLNISFAELWNIASLLRRTII
jgi:hypothetical protein